MSKLSVTPECDCARAALPIDSPMPHVPGCPAYGYNEPLMKPPAPKPCNDCPWRRNAAPGWLGPHTAEEWCQMAHGDGQIACHQTIPEGTPEDGSDLDQMTACAGAAIFRANVCKAPRSLRGIPGYAMPADRERVFSWDNEFIDYHNRTCTCGCHAYDGAPHRQPCKACGHNGRLS